MENSLRGKKQREQFGVLPTPTPSSGRANLGAPAGFQFGQRAGVVRFHRCPTVPDMTAPNWGFCEFFHRNHRLCFEILLIREPETRNWETQWDTNGWAKTREKHERNMRETREKRREKAQKKHERITKKTREKTREKT